MPDKLVSALVNYWIRDIESLGHYLKEKMYDRLEEKLADMKREAERLL